MCSVNWLRFTIILFGIGSEISFSRGLKWSTEDAIFQDVWPEEINPNQNTVKLKRASSASIPPIRGNHQQPFKPPNGQEEGDDDDDDGLVFEGRYFKPNEVPPPPDFMVARHRHHNHHRRPPKNPKQSPLSFSSSPTSLKKRIPFKPPKPQKFTAENAKPLKNSTTTTTTDPEVEGISSSNSKNILVSSPIPLEELQLHEEELQAFEKSYKDAPKCFTPTDIPGRCIPFRNCFPVVFNVIDGDLRNPGLAKLLYQASGPCNASLELDFALRKTHKKFFDVKFYNQSICCPGFKHPPTLLKAWSNDVRSARLIQTAKPSSSKENSTGSYPTANESEVEPEDGTLLVLDSEATESSVNDEENNEDKLSSGSVSASSRPPPLKENESSVEIDENGMVAHDDHDDERDHDGPGHGGEGGVFLELGEIEIDAEDGDNFGEREELRLEAEPEIVDHPKLNAEVSNRNYTRLELEDIADVRHNPDKFKYVDPYFAVRPPNYVSPAVSPVRCQHQLHGMPRGHWPWMVALVLSSRHICSGVLIDEKHVLTAAHCVFLLREPEIRKLRLIIGDRVMYSSVDGPHFWRKVSRIITHVNYDQQTFASDIAILKMNSGVPFSRNVQPISLPSGGYFDSRSFRSAIVAGWSGADIGQPAFEARTEVETVVEIMNKEECREAYRGFALSGIATNTFCTKPANNTCVADSGTGLFVRAENCWRLLGIMSWGIGCSHFPEVFTEVSQYMSWIRKHVN